MCRKGGTTNKPKEFSHTSSVYAGKNNVYLGNASRTIFGYFKANEILLNKVHYDLRATCFSLDRLYSKKVRSTPNL